MKSNVTWEDIRDILDILQIEDGSRVMSIKIDPDMVHVEYRYGLKGFREDSVYITGDVAALEREPIAAPTLADATVTAWSHYKSSTHEENDNKE